jgi:hypothetical protein
MKGLIWLEESAARMSAEDYRKTTIGVKIAVAEARNLGFVWDSL